MRTLFSCGLLGSATMALVPLGCSSARIRYPEQDDDRPRVPAATAERLRACVDELGGELERGEYTFDATVKVDEEGRVVDVKGKGVPHPELAICMRIALRGMTVPEELLRLRTLRVSETSAPANGQTAAEGGLVGHPGALVAVVIVLAELVIEAAPVAIAITAAVEVTGEIAEAVQKKPRWQTLCDRALTECLNSPRQSDWGDVPNSSRCVWCRKLCNEKGWPEQVPVHDGKFVPCRYKTN
ncbi:hypothetical protein [Polyangium spumosum]|uniref:Uncharacterized protein n=1 Tax=Polyangium spumosum TaxID=889282 RepID=A0A6N7PLZ1_9BACT|nr:hypothetical protein [Polyangium spumosum]MRG91164.1 hypothetical protein [Polyangium spumosum]